MENRSEAAGIALAAFCLVTSRVADAQKEYKRARARVEAALDKLTKTTRYLDAQRIHRAELTPAIEMLLAAKLALLRESKEEPETKKTIRPSNRYLK
jgi:hypothetical protein